MELECERAEISSKRTNNRPKIQQLLCNSAKDNSLVLYSAVDSDVLNLNKAGAANRTLSVKTQAH